MKQLNALVIATATLFAIPAAADAQEFRSQTRVWVKIKAKPGEGRWQACRRVFRHDVYQVRRGPGDTMWCNVEHHHLFDYGGQLIPLWR